jgi:transposase InsO family protein
LNEYLDELGVKPSTYHRWLQQRLQPGDLENKKPVPQEQPRTTAAEAVARGLNLTLQYPNWGEEKLSNFLVLNNISWLSPSTTRRIKKKAKEVLASKNLIPPMSYEFINPNDAWALDFLEFKWGKHTLYILPVVDDCSRYVLNWSITTHPTTQLVKDLLDETVSIYGLPKVIKTDNGSAFRKQFKKYLKALNIEHYPSPVRTPSYNGKVERLNLDLRDAANSAAKASTIEDCINIIGKAFYEHNYIRPHQALGGITPYQRYTGLEEQIKTQVKLFKEQQLTNRGNNKLWAPGKSNSRNIQNILLPGQSGNKTQGLIVPVKSKQECGKTIGFVRQSFAI